MHVKIYKMNTNVSIVFILYIFIHTHTHTHTQKKNHHISIKNYSSPGIWNKMVVQEDPELTSSHGHTKLQLLTEQLYLRVTWRLAERIFHNKRYKEGATTKGASSLDPRPQQGDPKVGGKSKLQSSPKGARNLIPTSSSPAWGCCTGKTSPQNVWLWKPEGFKST